MQLLMRTRAAAAANAAVAAAASGSVPPSLPAYGPSYGLDGMVYQAHSPSPVVAGAAPGAVSAGAGAATPSLHSTPLPPPVQLRGGPPFPSTAPPTVPPSPIGSCATPHLDARTGAGADGSRLRSHSASPAHPSGALFKPVATSAIKGGRALCMVQSQELLLATAHLPQQNGHGLVEVCLVNPSARRPPMRIHGGAVRDAAWWPTQPDLVLSTGLDSTLRLTSLRSRRVAAAFKLPDHGFSCCWDGTHPFAFYCGLKNGRVRLFDVRSTAGCVHEWDSFGGVSNPVHSLCAATASSSAGDDRPPHDGTPAAGAVAATPSQVFHIRAGNPAASNISSVFGAQPSLRCRQATVDAASGLLMCSFQGAQAPALVPRHVVFRVRLPPVPVCDPGARTERSTAVFPPAPALEAGTGVVRLGYAHGHAEGLKLARGCVWAAPASGFFVAAADAKSHQPWVWRGGDADGGDAAAAADTGARVVQRLPAHREAVTDVKALRRGSTTLLAAVSGSQLALYTTAK